MTLPHPKDGTAKINFMSSLILIDYLEFGIKTFIQLIGTAMGTRLAPTYANIFLEKIDTLIQRIAEELKKNIVEDWPPCF